MVKIKMFHSTNLKHGETMEEVINNFIKSYGCRFKYIDLNQETNSVKVSDTKIKIIITVTLVYELEGK